MSNVFKEIELNQGIGDKGRVFGYDHKRHNFVTWAIVDEKLTIHSIENDDQEDEHGPISETREIAELFLLIGDPISYQRLYQSCVDGFAVHG